MQDILYSWKFESKKERWSLWYVIALSVVIGLVIWGFFTTQYGMSFIVLLVAGVTYFVENNLEDEIEVTLTPLWIKISENFFDYPKIESFSLIYEKENAVLLRLKINKKGIRVFDLEVNNDIALKLKEILPAFVQEDEKGELSFIEKITRLLKL